MWHGIKEEHVLRNIAYQNSPHEHDNWEVVSRFKDLDGDVVGNLATEITCIENRVDLIQLGTKHLQILFHTGRVGIAKILKNKLVLTPASNWDEHTDRSR